MTKYNKSSPLGQYGVVPDSGFFGQAPQFGGARDLPQNAAFVKSGSFPSSFSNANSNSYVQQTFLGATVLDFSISAGYGDSASQLSVSVINDEYNKSDNTPLGTGADIYHSGVHGDRFNPPPVGSPVFFTFGKGGLIDVENVYQWQTSGLPYMDDWMIDNSLSFTAPTPQHSGRYHFAFGGVLQGWTQNRNPNGFTFNVNVVDPRQILSNVKLILNNYAEGTYKTENIVNVYGFLEHNPSTSLLSTLQGNYTESGILTKYFVKDQRGDYTGKFTYMGSPVSGLYDNYHKPGYHANTSNGLPRNFPITGTGMSRRSSVGIPFYRIIDGISAQMRLFGDLPQEYIDNGFETFIRFRGYNYIIDFGSLPTEYIPRLYYVDFEEVSLLDFIQEICEIVNHELFVSLLPVNGHPRYQYIKAWNNFCQTPQGNVQKLVAGIIRIDAIDKTPAQEYGKIAEYIRDKLDVVYRNDGTAIDCNAANLSEDDRKKCLEKQTVTSSDIGFELTDVTTEKFVAGANEVNMYFFTGSTDRDTNYDSSQRDLLQARQYTHDEMITQQILPYYGMLGFGENSAVTIPRGFGAYQQILLDTTSLNVDGVGSYYVATEMELRCAMVSFERWKEFLLMYNDVYMESIEENDIIEGAALTATPKRGLINNPNLSNNYAVTVPRCVFESDRNYLGADGLPASPCAPPYGYPLYYKRSLKIGIPEGGLASVMANLTQVVTDLAKMKQEAQEGLTNSQMKGKNWQQTGTWINSGFDAMRGIGSTTFPKTDSAIAAAQSRFMALFNSINNLSNEIRDRNSPYREHVALIDNAMTEASKVMSILPRLARKQNENAKKVYNYIKNIAEECLGKKFLVKIPTYTNSFYQDKVEYTAGNGQPYTITKGPFGFKTKKLNSNFEIDGVRYQTFSSNITRPQGCPPLKTYLTSGTYNGNDVQGMLKDGALKSNYVPITDTVEFNYVPSTEGGFFDFDLYDNVFSSNEMLYMMNNYANKVPSGVRNLLVPQDLTSFISDNGRVSAYVRFDWSNYLSLEGFSANDYTQQSISTSGLLGSMMPDISNTLDNVGADFSFAESKGLQSGVDITNWTCAFVKCDLSDKFYMSPKTTKRKVKLFGRSVVDIGSMAPTRELFNETTCEFETSFSYYLARYIPQQNDPGSDIDITEFNKIYEPIFSGSLIDTRKQNLDYNNVYALITLPGRPVPLKDIRFRDAMYFSQNPVKMKHILTQDTIKDPANILGFQSPAFVKKPTNILSDYCTSFSSKTLTQSFHMYKETMKGMTFGLPQRMHVAVPSPVYPDVVSLSLESKERCYGPWITTLMNSGDLTPELAEQYGLSQYRNIGGKVEYIRDENLAPWNYNGHDLMNEAGRLKASYGNSLMLHSERGGFVYADAPSGISIGRALMEGGAYVTSVDVSVSTAGIQTTVKLDSYTPQWGKLDRQKEIQISQISRERQKLRDTKNQFIRRGIGKAQTSTNYGNIVGSIENSINDTMNRTKYRVGSVQKQEEERYTTTTSSTYTTSPGNPRIQSNAHQFYVGNTDNFGIVDEQQYHSESQYAVVEPENKNDIIATRNPQAKTGAVKTQIVNNEYRMSQYLPDSDLANEQGWNTSIG